MSELRIVARSSEPFEDRRSAGKLLGRYLHDYTAQNAVIAGIPRGGIIIASALAGVIFGDVDIVLARKLRAPQNPELAIGAVAENGTAILDRELVAELGVADAYIEAEKVRQMSEIAQRSYLYRRVHQKISLRGRIAIVTDDGIATGATMRAALWAARREKPSLLIAAVPVAPRETLDIISPLADITLCIRVPDYFASVGQFYNVFSQISDEEVVSLLKEASMERELTGV